MSVRETGLYYLQSRYYNPTWGRFLNADAYTSTGQGVLGNNMFAYCLNNPVNRTDVTGAVSLWYFLIVDHDMGFIHRMVVEHIKENNSSVKTEVSLSTFGRADIVLGTAVWEVKHAGKDPSGRTSLAWFQAMTYIYFNEELTTLGDAYSYSGTFYIQCLDYSYMVDYSTPKDGVILYEVTEIQNFQGEYNYAFVPHKKPNDSKQVMSTPDYAPLYTPGSYFAPSGGGGGLVVGVMALYALSRLMHASIYS